MRSTEQVFHSHPISSHFVFHDKSPADTCCVFYLASFQFRLGFEHVNVVPVYRLYL